MTSEPSDPRLDPRDKIATEVLRVHETSYGATAGRVTVHVLADAVLVFLDDLELSPLEVTLLEAGHLDVIRDNRAVFQQAIGSTFQAIVERATGRRVTSFLSTTSVSDRYSVELFRLAA